MTPHALVIGEALIDVVRLPDGSVNHHPGGSPANVAIGLGRLGRDVELLTWIGLDTNGATIRRHLEDSNVHLARGSESALHTSVATAFVDAKGVAEYDFDLTWAMSPTASPRKGPIVVHTGSIAAVLPPGGPRVTEHLSLHRGTATITYDPNARPALMGDHRTARMAIERVVGICDVVKVSDEDLAWLAPQESPDEVAQSWLMRSGPALVVVTRGANGATTFCADGRRIDVKAPIIAVADTVGAGDSFMAALIDGLWEANVLGADNRDMLREIDTPMLTYIMQRAVVIAAITVSRPGANPPWVHELPTPA